MAEAALLTRKGRPVTEVVLLTIEDAGYRLGISRSSAYRLVEDGELPTVDVKRKGSKRPKLRVHINAVDELIRRRSEAS